MKKSSLSTDLQIGNVNVNVSSLLYADDIAIVRCSVGKLQDSLNKLNETCNELGMKVNYGKTKIMKVGRDKELLNIKIS